ncbi:MAG: response regulator [Bacteroidota bacterium]
MAAVNILIIDDYSLGNQLTQIILSRSEIPVNVLFKESAEEGLAYLEETVHRDFPDIIISDIHLVQRNGIEFFEEISQKYPNSWDVAKFYITSSIAPEKEHIQKFSDAHITGFIEKPFMEDTFQQILENL